MRRYGAAFGTLLVLSVMTVLFFVVFDPASQLTRSPCENLFLLSDGRRLCYDQYGDPGGTPIFYFHSFPGSRKQRPPDAVEIAEESGALIITIDRPGVGFSDPDPQHSYTKFVSDIEALSDHLSFKKFSVLGFSSGTPYALACAAKIPHRIITVGLISPQAPYTAEGFPHHTLSADRQQLQFLFRFAPPLLKALLFFVRFNLFQNSDAAVKSLLLPLVRPDEQAILLSRKYLPEVVADLRESVWNSSYSFYTATKLELSDWGFAPSDVKVDDVYLWHGLEDVLVPRAAVEFLAKQIPNCKLSSLSHQGHMSPFLTEWRAILETLAQTKL